MLLNVLLCLTVLLAYPDSARLAGLAYGVMPIGSTSGIRVSDRDSRDRLHLVYSKNWDGLGDSCGVYYTYTTDNGLTWKSVKSVSRNGDHFAAEAALAIDSQDALHCVWMQFDAHREPMSFDFYYSRGTDSGWTVPVNISRMATRSNTAHAPCILVDRFDRVHVAFEIGWQTGIDIYYTMVNGDTWLIPQRVSTSPLDDGFPTMAADTRGILHLCWRIRAADSGYIMYSRHDSVWSPPARIAACRDWANYACLAAGPDDRIHLVFSGYTPLDEPEVYYMCLVGDTWSVPLNLSCTAGVPSLSPSVAAGEDGEIHVVWYEELAALRCHLAYRYRDTAWSQTTDLTRDSTTTSFYPRLGVQARRGHADLFWVCDSVAQPREAPWWVSYIYYMKLAASPSGISAKEVAPTEWMITVNPTPVNGRLTIAVHPSVVRPRTADILNAAGRVVRRLVFGPDGTCVWDGRDNGGLPVNAGAYFVSVRLGNATLCRNIVKL